MVLIHCVTRPSARAQAGDPATHITVLRHNAELENKGGGRQQFSSGRFLGVLLTPKSHSSDTKE